MFNKKIITSRDVRLHYTGTDELSGENQQDLNGEILERIKTLEAGLEMIKDYLDVKPIPFVKKTWTGDEIYYKLVKNKKGKK
jgi:hypothetical protein